MKKLKLLGSLAAMLLLPSVVHAEDDIVVTLETKNATNVAYRNSNDVVSTQASISSNTTARSRIDAFNITDGDYTFTFDVTKSNGFKTDTDVSFPKPATGANRYFQVKTDFMITLTAPENYYIKSVVMSCEGTSTTANNLKGYTSPLSLTYSHTGTPSCSTANYSKSHSWTYTKDTSNPDDSYPHSLSISGQNSSGLINIDKFTVTMVYVEPETPEEPPVSTIPTPPYSISFTTGEAPEGWTLYKDSDDENNRVNPFEITEKGLGVGCESLEHWAVSPLIHLEPGKYDILVGVFGKETMGGVTEKLGFTCSSELPTKTMERLCDDVVIVDDKNVSDVYREDDEGNIYSEYRKPVKVRFEVEEAGDYYIGILNCSELISYTYPYESFNLTSFSITEYEVEVPEWTKFEASGKKVTITGKYDIQQKNGGAILKLGNQTVNPKSTAINGNNIEFTVEEFNGDYDTITVTIPADAYVTSEGNAYPEVVNQDINIDLNLASTVFKVEVNTDEKKVVITMDKNGYGHIEPTARFTATLIDYWQEKENQIINLTNPVVGSNGNNSTITFDLPTLEDGDFDLEIGPKSLRACEFYSEVGHSAWIINGNTKRTEYKFTIKGKVNFNDEVGNYYETIDNTYAQLKYGMLDADKNVIIPASVDYEGKTYFIKEIGEGAFKNKEYINDVQIPSVVTTIGKEAFAGSYIRNLTIPANVVVIGESAFNGASVGDLYLDNTAAEWALVNKGENAFAGNAFLYSYVHYPAGSDVTAYNDLDVDTEVGAFFPTHFVRGNEARLDINDGNHYYCIGNPATNVNVTYSRRYNGNWSALFLPFDLQVSTITAKGGKVAKLSRMSEGEIVWDFVNEGVLSANTPYLVKLPANELDKLTVLAENAVDLKHHNDHGEFSIVDGEFKMLEEGETPGEYSLRGTYVTITDMETQGYYAIASSDGNFHPAQSDDVTLKPYRIYLVKNDSMSKAPVRSIIRGEDTVTSVEDLDIEVVDRSKYINLNGNRVANPDKGIYIVNGKKVVIK